MIKDQESSSTGFSRILLLILVFVAVLNALINLFVLGGDAFVINLNNSFVVLLSIGVTIVSSIIMGQLVIENRKRFQWLGMLTGWILWCIAEILWAIFSFTGKEVPYPSWADLFWLIGYIPIGWSLILHIRGLLVKPNRNQKIAIIVFSFLSILITLIYLVIPLAQDYQPGLLIETIVNFLFIFFDLLLLLFSLIITFSPQKGIYGQAWVWFSVGFLLHSFSNNVFLFSDYNGIYYPDFHVNILSSMVVDFSYNLSYLCWFGGLIALQGMLRGYEHYSLDEKVKSIPNTNLLFFIDKTGTVIHYSDNVKRIYNLEEGEKKRAADTLGLHEHEISDFVREISENNLLREKKVEVIGENGLRQEAWISGLAIRSPQKDLTAVILLVRLFTTLDMPDQGLSDYQHSILDNLLKQLGSNEENLIKQMLLDYYFTYIKAIFDRCMLDGGIAMSDAFQAGLRQGNQKNSWGIQFSQQGLIELIPHTVEDLKNILPAILITSRKFLSEQSSEKIADSIINNVTSRIEPSIHKKIKELGLLVEVQ